MGRATGYPCRRGDPADRGGGRAALPRLPRLGYRAASGVRPAGAERRAEPGMAAGAGPGRRRGRQPGAVRRRHGQPFAFIRIPAFGKQWRYTLIQGTVIGKQWVAPTDTAVLDPVPGHPRQRPDRRLISLITCDPAWTGTHRVIVTGVLVAAKPR